VCVLPSGTPSTKQCNAGTAAESAPIPNLRRANLHNAISADGSRIFWTETEGGSGPGKVYVRIEGKETVAVSGVAETLLGKPKSSYFWGATANGATVVFTSGEFEKGEAGLFSFDVDKGIAAEPATTQIAKKVYGVLGMSEDARRIYFASGEVLSGVANSEGDKAQEDKPNLYLYTAGEGGEEPSYEFIGTLASTDIDPAEMLSPVHKFPLAHTSRVSPNGLDAAFTSTASLTHYDNTDAVSGEDDAEVFRYDAVTKKLVCASCNPSGARPRGTVVEKLWVAAQIRGWVRSFHASRALSDDGNRLFFESFEALVPRDTNGLNDVYEWEAPGKGSCKEGTASFVASAEGCIYLISSGESSRESTFIDASSSGDDVFFKTLSSLVPPDYGLVDAYDARVGGGFSYPEPNPPCEGEACQSPPGPPEDTTPASESTRGAGNVEEPSKARKPCPKGRHRVRRGGKTRCVKKHKNHRKGRAAR
jgi:hypothetical protein